MPRHPHPTPARRHRLFALLAALVVPALACGSDEDTSSAQAGPPMRDTTAPPIQREPLDQADQVGAEPFNLVMELPWTTNQVNRNATPDAAQAILRGVETLSSDGFDRTILSFADYTPFPGYRVLVTDSTRVTCGSGQDTSTVALEGGERTMVVRVRPARIDPEDGAASPGQTTLGQSRFQEGGLICAGGGELVWATTVTEGSQLRVLELRDSPRLVVDLR